MLITKCVKNYNWVNQKATALIFTNLVEKIKKLNDLTIQSYKSFNLKSNKNVKHILIKLNTAKRI